jgi:hypothetical protein
MIILWDDRVGTRPSIPVPAQRQPGAIHAVVQKPRTNARSLPCSIFLADRSHSYSPSSGIPPLTIMLSKRSANLGNFRHQVSRFQGIESIDNYSSVQHATARHGPLAFPSAPRFRFPHVNAQMTKDEHPFIQLCGSKILCVPILLQHGVDLFNTELSRGASVNGRLTKVVDHLSFHHQAYRHTYFGPAINYQSALRVVLW